MKTVGLDLMRLTSGFVRAVALFGTSFLSSSCLVLDLAAYSERSVNVVGKVSGPIHEGVSIGDSYELKMDLFLVTEKIGSTRRLALGVPEGVSGVLGFYSAPPSIADYYTDREKWPRVVNVVPKGTHIEVVEVKRAGTPMWGYSYNYYGRLCIDGWPNDALVSMADILIVENRFQKDEFLVVPNPNVLAGGRGAQS